jgi:3-oxoacyl-[acyl-carrier-protein] synthase II
MEESQRIVITGIGLTAPNGNDLAEYRASLLAGESGVREVSLRHIGRVPAGICDFDVTRYRSKKDNRRGTRAGAIAVYCAREALADAGLASIDRAATGVFLGLTEHGTVETEHELHNLAGYGNDLAFWSHHHNPRTVLNNPAGEVTLNLGVTGPHYTLGGACAAGNLALIHAAQMLRLGEVELALAGGVSESTASFGIFASFRAQGALAASRDPRAACRPFDRGRNGIVVAEGGCVMTIETLARARARGARIYGEIAGYAVNSDARDFVLPFGGRQAECMALALKRAGLRPGDVDLVSSHATGTPQGDIEEARAINTVFAGNARPLVNNTKSLIGHAMGAAGALELAGNLPSFTDGRVHPTVNLDDPDPQCALAGIVAGRSVGAEVRVILNNSFGMLGINSVVVVKKPA